LQHAPIKLDLCFARAANEAGASATAATLAFEVGPSADEATLLIGKVCEFNLQAAFTGAGAGAKNFEDEAGAVQHLDVPGALQVTLLHRADGMIDDDELGAGLDYQFTNLLDLAGAEERGGARCGNRYDQRLENIKVDRLGKALGLAGAFVR
jgi:hypothetical protein